MNLSPVMPNSNVSGVLAPVWAELLGQPEAIAQLEIAIRTKADGVYHAWLITGPPGSGRSNMAHAFAAALLCEVAAAVCDAALDVALADALLA